MLTNKYTHNMGSLLRDRLQCLWKENQQLLRSRTISSRGPFPKPPRTICGPWSTSWEPLNYVMIIQPNNVEDEKDVENAEHNMMTAAAPSADIKVPVIWVLGGPGSGKGTQCEKIVAKYGFTHLSSGDLLRNEVKSGSPRGKELNEIMERGELVPMDVVLDLIKEEMMKELPHSKGYLIDGYPREKEQGIAFEKKIAAVSVVLFFDAPDNVLVERLLGRAKTSGRIDDNEETIKKRLNTFNTHNDQVVQQYIEKLKKINAERDPEVIFAEVQTYLDPLVKC